jgi:hypothetical protein
MASGQEVSGWYDGALPVVALTACAMRSDPLGKTEFAVVKSLNGMS